MKKTDVLIIGGSASGVVTAITGKNQYPDKEFLIIRREDEVLVPCGIPYVFGSLENSNQNLISDGPLKNSGVQIMIGEVVSIDYQKKICKTAGDEEIGFEKLVMATGSDPKMPDKITGIPTRPR